MNALDDFRSQEPLIPPPLKHIAREHEQHVLRLEIALHDEPIQSEDDLAGRAGIQGS